MGLSTLPSISSLNITKTQPGLPIVKYDALLRTRTSIFLSQTSRSAAVNSLRSRVRFPLRATTSDESSSEGNQYQYAGDKRDTVVTLEEVPSVEKNVYNESVPVTEAPKEESAFDVPIEESAVDQQPFELLDNLNIKLETENSYSLFLYGGGALVAVWLAAAIVGAVDSIPLIPKLLEVVGLGYSFWFTTRYLLFKKNRDELADKIEELKQQVLGSDAD